MQKKPPARLHVLLASNARLGLVIRRGPSMRVCTLLWDRKTDEFTLGQWLRGRIYERRCDLSPTGRHFLYFAMGERFRPGRPPFWTAVSRAPYLRAIALYGAEETWLGGGQFTSRKTYYVNSVMGDQVLRESNEVKRKPPKKSSKFKTLTDLAENAGYPITGDLGVYYPRLIRDGWRLLDNVKVDNDHQYDIFEKNFSKTWTLRKQAHRQINSAIGKGVYWDDHILVNRKTEEKMHFPDWEWLDIDGKRLVWATKGQLWGGQLNKEGLKHKKMLYDFNGMKHEDIKAPYD